MNVKNERKIKMMMINSKKCLNIELWIMIDQCFQSSDSIIILAKERNSNKQHHTIKMMMMMMIV